MPRRHSSWIPPWVRCLGTATWISDPRRRICYINNRAEALLGITRARCLGRSCQDVVRGQDANGRPFCGPQCRSYQLAEASREIEPVEIRIGGPGPGSHWIQLLTIAVRDVEHGGPWLVHCVLDFDRAHRIQEYVRRVASRSSQRPTGEPVPFLLTTREREILRLLSEDWSLKKISLRLHVSYVTVRNHVQHILSKLGVHSIREAVAYYLLDRDQAAVGTPRDRSGPRASRRRLQGRR